MSAFQAVKVSEHVLWVGAIDWGLRDFHGYATSRGTTYNAYLILSDPVTLVDTVKAAFKDEMLARISSAIEPRQIGRIISNHSEMDHSGALPEIVSLLQPQEVIASAQGKETLARHFHWDREVEVAEEGRAYDLGGGMRVRFVETPMLHWPDSMFTYLEDEGVLFSHDAFGMHLAGSARFVDGVAPEIWRLEAAKYFANILMPLSAIIVKQLGRLAEAKLVPRIIAPDHGPIWRRRPENIVRLYSEWAKQAPTRKAVVVHGTMWQSTSRMAAAVGEGLAAGGLDVCQMPLSGAHRSDVATELLEAGALLVGSPTINNQIYPTVADVLTYLKGLRPKNLLGAAFGSYGWSGQAVALIEGELREMKIELAAEGLRLPYVPDAAGLERCRLLGEQVAAKLRERLAAEG
jgi:flavorubredoxin